MRHFGSPRGELPAMINAVDLSFNNLESLTLSALVPNLRHLNLDSNALVPSCLNLKGVPRLDVLSLRRQSVAQPFSFQEITTDISALNLSFNPLHEFPQLPPPNLLHTLELASCGLTTLPEDIATAAPNLQVLNLNSNAIKDIRPLLKLRSLTTLLIAGNRLARLRKTVAVLAQLERLDVLDLRDNPFTLGFYAPSIHDDATFDSFARPPSRDAGHMVLRAHSDDGHASARESGRHDLSSSSPRRPGTGDSTASSRRSNDSRGSNDSRRRHQLQLAHGGNEASRVAEADAAHLARLDADTRLRRRVHEMLLLGGRAKLRRLDGLAVGAERRKEVMRRDEVWERLVALGVLRRSEGKEGRR
jgi:hypothetical protein